MGKALVWLGNKIIALGYGARELGISSSVS